MKAKHPPLVVISDTHCGCQLGLCPSKGIRLDEGGFYKPNATQRAIWEFWKEFWGSWVPKVIKGKTFSLVLNGDSIDGRHHQSTHQFSQNLADQETVAYECLSPIVEKCHKSGGNFYMVRGTEAHVGPSGEGEESLAKALKAKRNKFHQYSRYDLWIRVGSGLVHLLHTLGTTGSQAYEATAPHKEMIEEYAEAARWRDIPPDCIVRSHRHRCYIGDIPAAGGRHAISVVTPSWQAKTPFAYRTAGARLSPPQFGGIVIKEYDDGLYTRAWVKTIGRSATE